MRWIVFSLFFSAALAAEIPSNQDCFVESGEAKLFCSVMGSGEPVVLLHGGPGLSYDYLLPQMRRLAESRQLIFYDQRGAGRSEGGDDLEHLNMEVFIEDLEAIRRHFGLKKLKLIGHSWGGLLAMHYAIAHPECVEQLILLHPAPVGRDEYALFLEEFGRRAESFLKELTEMQTSKEFMDGDPEAISHFWRKLLSVYFAKSNRVEDLNLKTTKKAALGWIKVDTGVIKSVRRSLVPHFIFAPSFLRERPNTFNYTPFYSSVRFA
ncbi:MAG: alpha/beta fold hydrolase [Chlamydiae bacterium]|nr:alpha/beta fold hydrolase [Chlamydiota bacterium]